MGHVSSLPIVGGAPAASTAFHPTVDALDELWEEIAQAPLWAPPNLGRCLRLRWRMRLRLLDPKRVRLYGPPGKLNDCNACTDICCVGPRATVQLRLRDIATLIDVGRTDLITHDRPQFSAAELQQRPALRRNVGSEAWSIFPVLRRNSMGACAALSTEGKCQLYPSWPLSCARFPYSLHVDTASVFFSQRCDSFWVRPDATEPVRQMVVTAVDAYNHRIKDRVLLEYAAVRLAALGLLDHLRTGPG